MNVKYIPDSWNYLCLEFTDEYLEKKKRKKEKREEKKEIKEIKEIKDIKEIKEIKEKKEIKEIKELESKQKKTPIIENTSEAEFCLKKNIKCIIL